MRHNKNETHRCSYCTYLIYSKKKVRKDKKHYHFTCYKRMEFDKIMHLKDIEEKLGEIKNDGKHETSTAATTAQATNKA